MTTTLDVARAARRAGVLDVTIVALESAEEIPADPEEIEEAEREGITDRATAAVRTDSSANGRVTGLETIGVTSVFDADGRFAPTFEPGTEAVIAADTVILAVGQAADLGFLDAGVDARAHSRAAPCRSIPNRCAPPILVSGPAVTSRAVLGI